MADRPFAPATETKLAEYAWPGNVRELENTMHRAVLLATSDDITPDAIMLQGGTPGGAETSAPQGATLVGKTVAEVERDLIIDTLSHCLGNRTHAANILGISIRTLRNKLKQYTDDGVAVPQPGEGSAAGA